MLIVTCVASDCWSRTADDGACCYICFLLNAVCMAVISAAAPPPKQNRPVPYTLLAVSMSRLDFVGQVQCVVALEQTDSTLKHQCVAQAIQTISA